MKKTFGLHVFYKYISALWGLKLFLKQHVNKSARSWNFIAKNVET